MTILKNLVGWGGSGVAEAVKAAASQQEVSVTGAAASTPITVPGLVTGQTLINTLALDSAGKPLSPQPVFVVTYGASGAASTIASTTSTASGTVRVTYGPADPAAAISRSSAVGNGKVSSNTVPTPAAAATTGYGADLGAIQANAVPTPSALVLPAANFTHVATSLSVVFADTSTYGAGAASQRVWSFGDGSFSTATGPTHVYSAAGTYDATLEITDANGNQSSLSVSITVS